MTISGQNHRPITAEVFGDLPDALINELLERSSNLAEKASRSVAARTEERDELRERALQLGLITSLEDLSEMPEKSVVAVDGSAAVIRLAAFELASAAALAVDGLGWGPAGTNPPYEFEALITDPSSNANEITYGLMFCMEYQVAGTADRDLVMLDGAFSTGMVAISIALRVAADLHDDLSEAFKARWTDSVMELVPEILASDNIIALPKRSSANEFATQTQLFGNREIDANGRSTASLVLEAGEYAGPFDLERHFFEFTNLNFDRLYMARLLDGYDNVKVVYYKPKEWTHAFRIEVPLAIADDHQRLAETLEVVRRQTVNPAIMEPYPLYVADRFVKSLRKGVNGILESVKTKTIAEATDSDIAADMLNTYRTEPLEEVIAE